MTESQKKLNFSAAEAILSGIDAVAGVVDLTHPLEEGMPVYPGTPPFAIRQVGSLERDGFREKALSLVSHMGTHMDAPAHIFRDGFTLDRFPIENFIGSAVVADVRTFPAGGEIPLSALLPYEPALKNARFLLLWSGWSRFWGEERYFSGYPVLSDEAALWLSTFSLAGVGVDMISLDSSDSRDLPVHRRLLGGGLVLIENLTQLELIHDRRILLACFPLKIADADGSPVRAAAIVL